MQNRNTINPYTVVRLFEQALCDYTKALYCVTTTSCTTALLLALAYHLRFRYEEDRKGMISWHGRPPIEIPKLTYIGVPMSIIHAGGWPVFHNGRWLGGYELGSTKIFDCARWLRGGMYKPGAMMCLSFHPSKHLGISTHGGAILLDDPIADQWLREARFDGRLEDVPSSLPYQPRMVGYHAYMNPVTAAEGLEKLSRLPRDNEPLPNSNYPDLSLMEVFK